MNIYFAGAIRGGRDDRSLYFEIVERLGAYGSVLTEHTGAEALSSQGEDLSDSEIHDRDLAWLRNAQCLIAEVTRPSLGVGYEIGKATEWGMPVLCLFRPDGERALSAMIAGSGAVTLREYRTTAELKNIFDEFLRRL
jgi:hypothetical protein